MTPSPIMPRSLNRSRVGEQPVADVVREQALLARALDLRFAASGPTTRGRRRTATPMPSPSASHMSSACSSVLMHARSAACIGCSGSMASGTPALRASGRIAAMPSCTLLCGRRSGPSSPAAARPPPAPGIARRARAPPRSRAGCRRCQSFAVKKPPRHRPVTVRSVCLRWTASPVQAHLRDLVAPGRDAADAVARAAVDHLREVPLLAHRRGIERQLHHSVPGGNSLGRNSGICGKMMISASTTNIGISMIITSLSASTMRILATAHEIIRHRP